ncbi:hypothetical protein HZF05_03210 [Sphingomonas sp. CGMCC 1.13654]|uniref:Uncharacterized protein n=1 Tax=Sphingomonas chungangi TaxID=2683589 RepID=A0A838L3W5_9SPHN|nr:hypothetical protein [Sphingomonas chungangi]MBA2933099.1 hypothetical protein [Sphingomonas chungangi]MVW56719.1 hypothetical protein [Sphingomonas chungangi]
MVYDDHVSGLGTPPLFGVSIARAGDDPVSGQIAAFGGEFTMHWNGNNQLDISPECNGWIGESKKSVDIAGRNITIRLGPILPCPTARTS